MPTKLPFEEKSKVQLALSDVEFIRNTIEKDGPGIPDRTEVAVTAVMFVSAVLLLITERVFIPDLTSDLTASTNNPDLRRTLLVQAALLVGILGAGVYTMTWLRARELQSSLARTLSRNFQFLRFESFLPDLALKAFMLTVLFSTDHLQYLSALLVAFIADYALQGRFFRMRLTFRVLAGSLIYGIAVYMMLDHVTAIALPLITFAAVSFISLMAIFVSWKKKYV